jgi:hypothetical protein
MGFGNLNALVVDHLYWSATHILSELKRIGISHEYANSPETAEILIQTGRQTGAEGYGMIITETAVAQSELGNANAPAKADLAADPAGAGIVTVAKPSLVACGPDIARFARSHCKNLFVIAYSDDKEHKGLWTPDNSCDHFLLRKDVMRYGVLEMILRERLSE